MHVTGFGSGPVSVCLKHSAWTIPEATLRLKLCVAPRRCGIVRRAPWASTTPSGSQPVTF